MTTKPDRSLDQQLAHYRRTRASRQITVDQIDWRYHVAGDAGPHVLLLPGAVGGGELFFVLAHELSTRYRVIAADPPAVNTVHGFVTGLTPFSTPSVHLT